MGNKAVFCTVNSEAQATSIVDDLKMRRLYSDV